MAWKAASIVPASTAAIAAVEGDEVQFDVGMRAAKVLQGHCRYDAPGHDVDPQRAPAGAHGVGALSDPEQFPGVGQECLTVDRELGAAGRAREQAHIQAFLQCRDALGDRLLSDRQRCGSVLELALVRGGDERAHGIEIHYWHNLRLWLATRSVV